MANDALDAIVPPILRASPHVDAVEMRGSRADGTATPLSDWDFVVSTSNFEALATDLWVLFASLRPLAQQWDRLSTHACYMLTLSGPVKVDLIFESVPQKPEPPWSVNANTMQSIDAHFWDWILWLTSKVAKDRSELVETELQKMFQHLLSPMGVDVVPTSLAHAVKVYLAARADCSKRTGIVVPDDLEREVVPVVRSLRAA